MHYKGLLDVAKLNRTYVNPPMQSPSIHAPLSRLTAGQDAKKDARSAKSHQCLNWPKPIGEVECKLQANELALTAEREANDKLRRRINEVGAAVSQAF